MISTLFYNPMELHTQSLLWMLIPLCLVVAIIYKTVRTNNISRLWWEILWLFGYIMGGLSIMGVAAWLIMTYWP